MRYNEASPEIIEQLRDVAAFLEASKGNSFFPSWHRFTKRQTRENDIISAGSAIAKESHSTDEGSLVPTRAVGCLLRYIADMMEE